MKDNNKKKLRDIITENIKEAEEEEQRENDAHKREHNMAEYQRKIQDRHKEIYDKFSKPEHRHQTKFEEHRSQHINDLANMWAHKESERVKKERTHRMDRTNAMLKDMLMQNEIFKQRKRQ